MAIAAQDWETVTRLNESLSDMPFYLLATMAKIQSGEMKWSSYDEVFG